MEPEDPEHIDDDTDDEFDHKLDDEQHAFGETNQIEAHNMYPKVYGYHWIKKLTTDQIKILHRNVQKAIKINLPTTVPCCKNLTWKSKYYCFNLKSCRGNFYFHRACYIKTKPKNTISKDVAVFREEFTFI